MQINTVVWALLLGVLILEVAARVKREEVPESQPPISSPGPGHPSQPTPGPPISGTVTFSSLEDMAKETQKSPLGTFAYVVQPGLVLVRVPRGWQTIVMGELMPVSSDLPLPAIPSAVVSQPELKPSNLMLRIAALNEPYTGGMNGTHMIDHACFRQAQTAGFSGTYRAFLSSRIQNLDTIVNYKDWTLPVINIKGDVLFNSWKSIFTGKGGHFAQHLKIYSFNGKDILTDNETWPMKYIWHGSLESGVSATELYCDAWDSNSPDKLGLASSLQPNHQLLGQERFSCNNSFAVLCVQVSSHEGK